MTPFQGREQCLDKDDGDIGYSIPPKWMCQEFIRKADAFLARREGARGKFNFASQQFVQEGSRDQG